MQCKIKTSKKNNFTKFLIDFSCKKKAITRYTRIYIKLNDRDNTKQAKKLYFHSGPSTKTVEMQQ